MQFSYGISEADYRTAWKLRRKSVSRPKIVKTLMFWVFVMICLLVLWTIVQKGANRSPAPVATDDVASADDSEQPNPRPEQVNMTRNLVTNVGPFVLIGGIWFFMLFQMGPGRLRKLYRSDPAMRGRHTVEITSDFLAIQNSVGFSSRSGWNIYESWKEGKELIVLGMRSQAYFVLGLAELSPGERDELRAILGAVLPKK